MPIRIPRDRYWFMIIETIRNILGPLEPRIVWNSLKRLKEKRRGIKQIEEWQRSGCPSPPPHIVKQRIISEYQQKYGCTTLVETGTFLGDMVEAQKARFLKIISIELGVDLFEKAKKRFKHDKNVILIQGDSGKVLPKIVEGLSEPALFWLDGHYSAGITAKGDKECPIIEELDAILRGNPCNHVLLIDDARCFIGQGDYPTIERLTEFVRSKNEKYRVEVKNDIIRYVI
jgi:hypothetical protein